MSLTPEELSALNLSLRVGLWCVVLSLGPAVAMGWLLGRRQFYGKALIEGLLQLPLVLPPVVTGYFLLLALGRNGWLGAPLYEWFGVSIAFTWQGAVLASIAMSFPLTVRAVRLSMSAIEPRIEQAAGTLGARPLEVFFTVTLPLAAPGVITGAILAFARSLGEFGATITFVGNIANETRTLPLGLYSYTQIPDGEGPALRLAGISVVIAFAALLASEWLARRTEQRLGR